MPRQARLDAPGTLHHVMVLAGMGKGKDCMDFESRIWGCAGEIARKLGSCTSAIAEAIRKKEGESV